ncbi:hypothetical protein DPMN_029032 [Dreissena polymorpha]|uniref:Uncharacterized protein n=1 Tax=Dreissena polymorpha TaxID=45954 RepID=A0A9D4LY06_DREPO|nr:hypothetical protein DPMN_029032 [Dreissena polymorpha]
MVQVFLSDDSEIENMIHCALLALKCLLFRYKFLILLLSDRLRIIKSMTLLAWLMRRIVR